MKRDEGIMLLLIVVVVILIVVLLLTSPTYAKIDDLSEENVETIDLSTDAEKSFVGPVSGVTSALEQAFHEEPCEEVEPEWIDYLCTAYCGCEKCVGKWHTDGYTLTASGWEAQEGVTIAADESYPFGTALYLEGMGERVVMDRGSAITGNRLDVYYETHEDALAFGMKQVRGYLLEVPEE